MKLAALNLALFQQNLSNSAECETILHEISHHLGLVDEYVDLDFPCRVPMEGENIMKHQKDALERAKTDSKAESTSATLSAGVYSWEQINSIIYPQCANKNTHYYARAKKANLTSDQCQPTSK